MANAVGHVLSGFFAMLILSAIATLLGDGRSLLKASNAVAKRLELQKEVGDSRYGIGLVKDSNGRLWTNDNHLMSRYGCDEHKGLGQASLGFAISTLLLSIMTVVVNLVGAKTGKARFGYLAIGLSFSMAILLGLSFALAGAFYDVGYTCTPSAITCPPKVVLPYCSPSFACGSGFQPKTGQVEIICPIGGCNDAVCCNPVVKKCQDWDCPSGYTHKVPVTSTYCDPAVGCNNAGCCDQTCDSVACQATYKNKGSGQVCGATGNCDHSFCCELLCTGHKCSANLKLRGDGNTILCAVVNNVRTCDDAQCCSATTCQTPAIFRGCRVDAQPHPLRDKLDSSLLGCAATGCTVAACCEPKPTCASSSITCPKLYTLKPRQEKISCEEGCTVSICCNAPASVKCNTYTCLDGYQAKPYGSQITCGIRTLDCDTATCCNVIEPEPCTQPAPTRRTLKEQFDLGYALPVLVVACVMAIANIVGLFLLETTKDEVRGTKEETRPMVNRPNEPIDESLDY